MKHPDNQSVTIIVTIDDKVSLEDTEPYSRLVLVPQSHQQRLPTNQGQHIQERGGISLRPNDSMFGDTFCDDIWARSSSASNVVR